MFLIAFEKLDKISRLKPDLPSVGALIVSPLPSRTQPLAGGDGAVRPDRHALPPLHVRLHARPAVGLEPRAAGPSAVGVEQKQGHFPEGWRIISPHAS